MCKIIETLKRMDQGWHTARAMFDAQQNAIDECATEEYWRGYDALLAKYGHTRAEYHAVIHDPALYTFYSTGLNEHWTPINEAIRRYSRSRGIFVPDNQFNAFTAHIHNAMQRKHGMIKRRGNKGHYEYSL